MMIGVKADLELAAKRINVVGGITTRKGTPSVFLRGAVDSLTRDDLVVIANDLASAQRGHVDAAIVGTVLPDFALRRRRDPLRTRGRVGRIGRSQRRRAER